MPFDAFVDTIAKLGLPKERVDELRKALEENVLTIIEDEEGEGHLIEVDDPEFVSESYLLEKEEESVRITSGDLELGDGGRSEFCILMDLESGPMGEEVFRNFVIVYSKVLEAEPELLAERMKAEVAIVRALCEEHGLRVVSTASGLMPLDLPRSLFSDEAKQFYKDLLFAAEQSIERDMLDADGWRRKASALYFFGELGLAEEALHRALVLDQSVSWPCVALGYIELGRGNSRLAGWLFRKGQEAMSKVTLGRPPLAAMDIIHPRGRQGKDVKGDWFEEDLCPNCDRRTWKNIDGVKGMCPKCNYQYIRRDVEVLFRMVPRRFFFLVGEPIVLELHAGNTLGVDIEIEEEGGKVQLRSTGKGGASGWEEIEASSALGRDVIPARTRFSTELKLDEAIPADAPFWEPLRKGGLIEVYGNFTARIKNPPSREYRRVEVFGTSTGTISIEVLDLKG